MEEYRRMRHAQPEPTKDSKRRPMITHSYLVSLCEYNEKYTTPHLNDSLLLNMKGFATIENLEEYYNLKSVYLNNNIIRRIENIAFLGQLKCLYLQNNLIEKIEGLDTLNELDTLNLSHNYITRVEGLTNCEKLTNLDLSKNKLGSLESIEELGLNPGLGTVALMENEIDYSPEVLGLFKGMLGMKVIHMKGSFF